MGNKQSWIQSLFGYKPAKQANTPPDAPQRPPEVAPAFAGNLPVPPAAPTAPTARKTRFEDSGPVVWKAGDLILGDIEVTDILGEGGMGTVYKIYYHPWHRELAVKCPKPEIFTRGDGKENFIREAEAWMSLGAYPHLVCCYFVRTLSSIPRVFAEYVNGGSLADWIRLRRLYVDGPEQALERVLDVSIQFAWGLHFAHERGLVHQDIKPANVMMTQEGVVKVTDFGLAKARAMAGEQGMQDRQENQSILVSAGGMTLAYCSPEQAAGQALNRKTDIWSWGLSVFEMFTGKVTWKFGVAAREVLASYQRHDPAIPVMPTDVMNLLERCFQPQPEARPTTMLEVATELQAIYAHTVGRPYSRAMPKPAELQVASLISRGFSLTVLGQREEALLAFEHAIHLFPNSAPAYTQKGIALRELGRREEELVAYEQAIHLDPNYIHAYYNKGSALRELGRREEALLAYEHAIRLFPNSAPAYTNKGIALAELGRREEALLAFEQAIRLDPNSALAYNSKGNVLGRREEALLAYEQAIRLDPNFADAYYNKGRVLGQLGQLKEALLAYQHAIRLDPNSVKAYNNQGNALQMLGRREEALLAYQHAIRLDPNFALAHNNKGAMLQGLGRLKEALLAYQHAIRLDPNFAQAYINLGSTLQQLGQRKEAEQAYQKGRELRP